MKQMTVWIADDGSEFDNEVDCLNYERRLIATTILEDILVEVVPQGMVKATVKHLLRHADKIRDVLAKAERQ